jgi:hypothetical protein
MSAKGSLVFIFVLVVMLACILLNTGCATAMLQDRMRAELAANGYVASPFARDIMVNEALPLGSRAVNLGTLANQAHPVAYKLAWVLDYVVAPSAALYGGYRLADEINNGGDDKGDTYNINSDGGNVTLQSGSGNSASSSRDVEGE